METRRVVITSVGAVSPLGLTSADLWNGLLDGRCGIERIKAFDPVEFPSKIAGEVPEYKLRNYVPKSHRKATKLMSRDIELSVIASDEAVRNSGLVTKAIDSDQVTIDPQRTAINFGAGLISCDLVELAPCVGISETNGKFDLKKWGKEGLESLTPLWLLKYLPNMLPCHVGIIHDIQGPSNTITCGEAASYIAVTEAMEMIVRGDADTALAGGGEAKVNPIVMMRQCLLKRATFAGNDHPGGACKPFDAAASGSVFGEAAGVLILEELGRAVDRKAPILAEIVGGGSSNSIHVPYEHLEEDGKGIEIAIRKALAQAGIEANQLDLIIPAGTGIAADDLAEAAAVKRVLGDAAPNVTVWPIKGQVSHTGAASGAIDLIAAALAIQNSKIGAASNLTRPAEGCTLNISRKVTDKEIKYALCCGYSFGGQTAAIVLKKYDGVQE